MAVSEYHLDTRIRRRHIPLLTQQRRLRHLRSVAARNILMPEKFQDVSNVAFTLHPKLSLPAFYTSEVISNDMNPCWKDFESSNFPENVDSASSYVIVRVWNSISDKQLLLEWVVFFSGLTYLGEQIPKEGKNFKPNTLLFGMSEGYYGGIDCYQHSAGIAADNVVKDTLDAEMASLRTSYTLSTLSRIKTVERAIKQTQAAVQRRRNSISNKLQSSRELHNVLAQQELLRIQISVLQTELQFQEKAYKALEKEVSNFKEDLVKKRNEISIKKDEQKKHIEKCLELSKIHNESRERYLKTEAQLNFRRKELISELCYIYPIVEFPDQNGYSIHNVHLPNSVNFSGHDDMMISVSLGYVCHINLMISQFLNVPLRYSINFYGSRSCITDHISIAIPEKTREFPLYLKNKDKRCFEYGVFLLNKNIAQLRIFCRLSTQDLSATLPNLSSLLELRLSTTYDSQSVVQKESKISVQLDTSLLNGLPDSINATNKASLIKTTESELEFLKSEMQAMIPNSTAHPVLSLPNLSKEAPNALSGSLDKGLDDIKLLEKSVENLEMERKEEPHKNKAHISLLRQTSHHSSYPNLNQSLQVAEGFNGDSMDPSLLATPPRLWTADSSRANSEEESVERKVSAGHIPAPPVVLNDTIFYIPSMETPVLTGGPVAISSEVDNSSVTDDFSADLSLRADRLANRTSSFQMQKIRSSSTDDQHSSHIEI